MKQKIIQNIKSIILALILVAGVSYVSAYSTWTAPTATAPGNNTDTPLNVSNTGQIKVGGLTLNTGGATNGLVVDKGLTILKGGLQFPTGAGAGKVLTSDASGNASWAAAAGGGGVVTGTLCGAQFGETCGTGLRGVILCQGMNPMNGCPTGYTQWYGGTGYCSKAWYCVAN